jgi:hypothetical protein
MMSYLPDNTVFVDWFIIDLLAEELSTVFFMRVHHKSQIPLLFPLKIGAKAVESWTTSNLDGPKKMIGIPTTSTSPVTCLNAPF